jgi:hypothetical protein
VLEDWISKHPRSRQHHVDRLRRLIESEKARRENGVEKLEDIEKIESVIAEAEAKRSRPTEATNPAVNSMMPMIGGMSNQAPFRYPDPAASMNMMQMMAAMAGQPKAAANPRALDQDRSLQVEDEEDKTKNELIRQTLLERMPMPFGQPTPLGDVFKYIKTSTTSEKMPTGLPIYVDPKTWEKNGDSEVMIDLDGVPLKTTLRLLLRQVDLGYYIRDGLLMIAPLNSPEYQNLHMFDDRNRHDAPFPDTISQPAGEPALGLPKKEADPTELPKTD